MKISREVIEAKSRKLDIAWDLEYEEPCVLHGKEIDKEIIEELKKLGNK